MPKRACIILHNYKTIHFTWTRSRWKRLTLHPANHQFSDPEIRLIENGRSNYPESIFPNDMEVTFSTGFVDDITHWISDASKSAMAHGGNNYYTQQEGN